MMLVSHLFRQVREMAGYTVRSGHWWVPVVIVVLSVAAALAITAKVVVPTAVYVLF